MPTLWNSEVNKAILEQVKVTKYDYDYMLRFFKKQKLCTQNYFQKQYITALYKFHIKIYIESFVSIYLELSIKVFSTT